MLPRRIILSCLALTGVTVVAQKPNAVTGVPVDPSAKSVPLRKNINDLEAAGGPQWDLYIQALAAMQEEDDSNPVSYFQIAGIHGRPYIEWNGGGGKRTNEWGGYCPHGEKLFVTWHRPYVALFEQTLVEHAKRLALTYPQNVRPQYIKAAEELRSPFWDWGLGQGVPPSTVPETLQVNIPRGGKLEKIEIDNPLATFRFPRRAIDGAYGTFDSENRTQTYRCATSPDSYPDSANRKLAARPYKRWVYDAFTHAKNFAEFASTADGGISLEQIHNGVHWDAGCAGQFLTSEFSAFDPIFMMHHTNVDRLWSYWQAIMPRDTNFGVPYEGGPRFSTPRGTRITPDSPLNPFSKPNGDFHTSRSIERIRDFGYSYQGLEWWSKSASEMAQESKRLINQWYGPGDAKKRQLRRAESPITRYFVKVALDVTQVERPCTVDIFVGDKQAGGLVVMEQPKEGIIHGGFPLDDVLDLASIQELLPVNAVDTIQSSLQVSIVKIDGEHIPVETVPDLKVEIENVLVTPPASETELPIFGDSELSLVEAIKEESLPRICDATCY